MKSSDYIANFLVKHGIKHCYGFQGTMIAHLVDSICNNSSLENHVCYNEQGAAFAAVGEAKVTGKPAFAYATSGPGAVNLLSGIADAYYDSAPVIFITGQVNTNEYLSVKGIRQHAFQEMDVISAAKAVVKYCTKIEKIEDLRYALEAAWYYVNEGRPGPVLIDLPMNMQRQDINPENLPGFTPPESKSEIDYETIAGDIIKAIQEAKRPILALGNGITKSDRPFVRSLIEKMGVPVVTSMLGRDILPNDHPLNFGFIGSGYGHRYANIIANKKADLIVGIGSSLCKRQTGVNSSAFAREAKIIRVDIDPCELERRINESEKTYYADCNKLLRTLDDKVSGALTGREWVDLCTEIKTKMFEFDDTCAERLPNKIVTAISENADYTSAVCCDVGQHQPWCAQSYKLTGEQRLLFSGGHGAMGFALPASIGAHYGTGKPVVAVCGDGAFQMNIQELQWIKRENVPVTIVVLNNSALGLIHQQQDDIFDGRYYGSAAEGGYESPDFSAIGTAYGIKSYKINGIDDIGSVFEDIDGKTPVLIEVILDERSRAYPKTFFGEEMHMQRPYAPQELMDEILKK